MLSSIERLRRYAALGRAVLRARRRPFDPFKLTWIVTERCSLRCATCHLWAGTPAAGPDLATIRRVLDANRHLTWLNLSGGDLVERHDAVELMQSIAAGLPDLALLDFPTAGQEPQATLAALEPVLRSPIPRIYVTVSLDGPDALHDRLRGSPGAAARARETFSALRAIRRPGFHAAVGMTLSRYNVPAAPVADPSALLPPDVPPRDLHLNLAHHSGHYYRNREDVAPPPDGAGTLIDVLARRRGRSRSALDLLEARYWRLARRYLARGDAGQDCGALRASVYLGADLRVYPCTIFAHPLGNLADVGHELRRIHELPGAHAGLDLVQARRCPRCWSPCEAFPTLLLNAGRGA
jgi:MoaA/NifB/PqqE/SkfB family radical SAM enzyme